MPFTFFRCMKHYHGSVIADILDCDYDRISDLLLLRHNFVQVCFTVGVLMLVFINTGWGKLNQAMSHCESKKMPIISLNADRFSAFFHLQTRCIWTPGCNVLFIHLLILTPYCLKLPKSQTGGKGIVKTCTTTRKGMALNKNTGRKSLHHFVQRLLVRSVRQQVAKPQVLMMSQQNCSKREERQHWTECTEYVWRSGNW